MLRERSVSRSRGRAASGLARGSTRTAPPSFRSRVRPSKIVAALPGDRARLGGYIFFVGAGPGSRAGPGGNGVEVLGHGGVLTPGAGGVGVLARFEDAGLGAGQFRRGRAIGDVLLRVVFTRGQADRTDEVGETVAGLQAVGSRGAGGGTVFLVGGPAGQGSVGSCYVAGGGGRL